MRPNGVAQNTFYYTLSLISQKILSFLYFWYISNHISSYDLGSYIFSLSFVALFSLISDLGLVPIMIREASKNIVNANNYLKNIFGIKIPLNIIAIVSVIVLINFSGKSNDIQWLVYIAAFNMIVDSFTMIIWACIRAYQNLKFESIMGFFVQMFIFAFGILALNIFQNTFSLMMVLFIASVLNLSFAIIIIKRKLHYSIMPSWNWNVIRSLSKLIPAFAIGIIFIKIYNTSDSILLGMLASEIDVGYFSIPAKIINAFQQIIPATFAASIFPVLSSYFTKSEKNLNKIFETSIYYLITLSIPLTTAFLILSDKIVTTFWPTYMMIIPTFNLMILAIPFIFLAYPTGYLLNACNKQQKNTLNRGIMTILSLILNIILIPRYGYFGAGISFLIVNILVLLLDIRYVMQIVHIDWKYIFRMFIKSLFSAISMILIISYLENQLTLLLVIPLGIIIYFTILFFVRGLEIRRVESLFHTYKEGDL